MKRKEKRRITAKLPKSTDFHPEDKEACTGKKCKP